MTKNVITFVSAAVAIESPGCDFNSDLCGYSQDVHDAQDWKRHKGPTSTYNTGPDDYIQTADLTLKEYTDPVEDPITPASFMNKVYRLLNNTWEKPETGLDASDYYMYMETSNPTKSGDKARLVSPAFDATVHTCLRFSYHMYGADMGKLTGT